MSDAGPGSEAPAWRETVFRAAHQATLDEAARRWGTAEPLFNYRWEHVQAVVRLAIRLAELTGADREIVEAAAWLHDICKQGKDDRHGSDGAAAAREILVGTDFPAHKIASVADAIAKHVGLVAVGPLEPLEAAVLWDADKLAKLGATAVIHFIGYRLMGDAATTGCLMERLSSEPWQSGAVRSLHTLPAQKAGSERLEAYRAFWERARREVNGDDL